MKRVKKCLLLMAIVSMLLCVFALHVSAESQQVTVYLDAANGADTNSGLEETQAVATLEKAYSVLAEQITGEQTGRIVLVSDYTVAFGSGVTNQTICPNVHPYEVVITGKTADVTFYVKASKAAQSFLRLQGPTTFENVGMKIAADSAYTNILICGNGGLFKIGENVTTGTTNLLRLMAAPAAGYTGDMSIEVNSGDWQDLCAGAYAYTMNGNASLVMNGGSVVNLETTYNGKHNGNTTITINGGTVTNLYGGSRNKSGVITGDITVNLCGGTVSKLMDTDGIGTLSGKATLNLVPSKGLTLGVSGTVQAAALTGGTLNLGASTRVNATAISGTTVVRIDGTPAYETAYITGTGAQGSIVYAQGYCAVSGTEHVLKQPQAQSISLKYDDRKDLKTLLGYPCVDVSVSSQNVSSNQVGSTEKDSAVLQYENGILYAVGTGTAQLTVNGTTHTVTVSPAPISLFMITGHSVGAGDGGNIGQSVLCEAGQVYSSHRPYALSSGEGGLGYGSAVRAGVAEVTSQQHLDAFTAEGVGTLGEGSALGYRWNQLTGDKVWVLNCAVGGSCLNQWQTGVKGTASWTEYHYDTAIKAFGYAQNVLKNEIAAGHYTFSHMAIFYHNGVNYGVYPGWSYEAIENDYETMWNGYKQALETDLDGDGEIERLDGLGLLPFYNFEVEYYDVFDKPAGYYMAASAEYADVFLASNIYFNWMRQEGLSSFPEITYTTQNGAPLNKPVSVAHSQNGGTSTDSVFCKADNMHPNQVVHNAVGMSIAENLYAYLNESHETEALVFQDQSHTPVTQLNMELGETKILVPRIQPGVKGNVTFEVSGVLELSYPVRIQATQTGTGSVCALVDGQVIAQVDVTVTESSHSHCVCGGHGAKAHQCESTAWTAWGDEDHEKNVLPLLSGNYYLTDDVTMNKTLTVDPGETVRICLNGYTIDTTTARVFNNQGILVVTDCSAEENWGSAVSSYSGSYSQVFYTYADSHMDIYAGNFEARGSSAYGCVGLVTGGVVNIYGGNFQGTTAVVTNNLATRGGTLYLMTGELNLYGGNICGGEASSGGNVYVEKGTLVVDGATISGGKATLGGNIYGSFYADIQIKSGLITGGTSKNEGGNLYLYTVSTTDSAGNTIPRDSYLTISGGTIEKGSASRGSQIFATTGANTTSGAWYITVTGGQILDETGTCTAIVLRSKIRAAISGGTLSSAGELLRVEKSKKTGPAPELTLENAVLLDGTLYVDKTNDGERPIKVTVNALTKETQILVDASADGTFANAQTDLSRYFTAAREDYAITWQEGKLDLVPGVAQANGRNYVTVEEAIAQGGWVKLLRDATVNGVLNEDLYIDLAGYDLTGTLVCGAYAVYGMDSATDAYTCENMGSMQVSDGAGKAVVPVRHFRSDVTGSVKRYLAIESDGSYSFHRFYMGMTHITLKPTVTGLGYKALFAGDDMVKAQLESYGYILQLEGFLPVTATKAGSEFTSMKPVTARIDGFDLEGYGETALTGKLVMRLTDGTVIESSAYSTTMRSLVETVNDNAADYSAEKLQALKTMLEGHKLPWKMENILNLA